ncbi:hypothetical protein J4E83_005349 [Alternaria metachromatica]|uniref:uncharacterized protein n=1 Tax=Alternaria metachromatica TaxID=283354 RepID=UPI0020C55919|nr:uncharacterized protein J4E83_005349 [Alternaria metachromatica]KAI4620986.1 hypothetical protein J4E83_005349 [Alternaria metachromatica]
MDEPPHLIIAVDYGTTFTGKYRTPHLQRTCVAFCETDPTGLPQGHTEVVNDWPSPGTNVSTNDKVPSEISYKEDAQLWGFQIPPDVSRHRWLKLLLQNGTRCQFPEMKGKISNAPCDAEKEPLDIIEDYLRNIKLHLFKKLDDRYGKSIWRGYPVVVVITYPSLWSAATLHRYELASRKAGFYYTELGRLVRFVRTTEAEAAAIYTIKTLQGTPTGDSFALEDGLMVVDMGGGTIDLASYHVSQLQPIVVEPATDGSSRQGCGNTVDKAFFRYLELSLGTANFIAVTDHTSEDIPFHMLGKKATRMLEDFSLEAKSVFSGTENFFIRLPGLLAGIADDEARGICDGEIAITAEDMKSMFHETLSIAYEEIVKQIGEANKNNVIIKHIFLVGGMAECPYVLSKITEFSQALNVGVTRPAYAWSAVVRGAITQGFKVQTPATTENLICPRHFGFTFSPPFIQGRHHEVDAFVCDFTGVKKANNQMEWLLKKDQALAPKATVHAKWSFQHFFWSGESRVIRIDLFASRAKKGPARVDKDVEKVATLRADMGRVPIDKFISRHVPGTGKHLKLEYELQLLYKSSGLKCSIVVDGVVYASATITA